MNVKPIWYRLWIQPRNGGGVELPIEIESQEALISVIRPLIALGETGPLGYRIELFRSVEETS
jgi:hypothetical protein